ncbi:hypothetical protein [Vibrio splendidus]|uniref:hypothetical protein n=1 Tax=Vibrio splendidus TaxID=29497 RepID=UPI003D0E7685
MKHLTNISFASSSLTEFLGEQVSSASIVATEDGLRVLLEYSAELYHSKTIYCGAVAEMGNEITQVNAWLRENNADMEDVCRFMQEIFTDKYVVPKSSNLVLGLTEGIEAVSVYTETALGSAFIAAHMLNMGWFVDGVHQKVTHTRMKECESA